MTDQPPRRSSDSDAARQARLREALRANLKRRKAQSRGRAGVAADGAVPETAADGVAKPPDASRHADPDQES